VGAGRTLIDEELERFMRGPVAVLLATADPMAVPDATRASGVAGVGGGRLRVLISAEARTARTNAQPGTRAAILVTDVTTYRSLQLKGRVVSAGEERTPGDVALLHRYLAAFRDASPSVGIPSDEAWRLFPVDFVPLVVEVDALFDQTPGPGAGRHVGAQRP
jgi:hypothetical protein